MIKSFNGSIMKRYSLYNVRAHTGPINTIWIYSAHGHDDMVVQNTA